MSLISFTVSVKKKNDLLIHFDSVSRQYDFKKITSNDLKEYLSLKLNKNEDQFRVMKGDLETRPIYVRTRLLQFTLCGVKFENSIKSLKKAIFKAKTA